MMLHIFNKPLSQYTLGELIINADDSILLISDACYSALNYKIQFSNHNLYALEQDMKARNTTDDTIELITDQQWVELIVNCEQHITW